MAGSTDYVKQDGDPWRDEPPGVTEARDERGRDAVLLPVSTCLAHFETEPCSTCAAYIAAGL